jgi:Cu(I)/Ag(I) efflux system membrane fusion protein
MEKLSVPKSAVLWTGERSVVYVKIQDAEMPSFEYREVILGRKIGSSFQVIDGLYIGDEVVTNGAFIIDASAQLNNQSSMMNRNLVSNKPSFMVPKLGHDLNDTAKNELNALIKTYMKLKESFVNSDDKKVAMHGQELKEAIENFDMAFLKEKSHSFWMKERTELLVPLSKMVKSKSIEVQRNELNDLSIAIIRITEAFQLNEGNFIQFCSMTNEKVGGYWMSNSATIRNPYYGSSMLSCGENIDLNVTVNKGRMPKQINNHNH